MFSFRRRLQVQWILARQGLVKFQTGGDWAMRLPQQVRQNLIYFFYDGFFASASDNIVGTYLVVYLLALGATQTQIGLMSSISSLVAAATLLPGALLVERIGRRKEITVFNGGIMSRLMLLALALIPFVLRGPGLVIAAIGLSITRDMFGNLAYPAWMSLTGDVVPIEGRGRYFSSRNIAMAMAGIVTTLLAGLILTRVNQPVGYQGAIFVAFLIALGSTISFARIRDHYQPAAAPAVQPQPTGEPSETGELPKAKARPGVLDGLGHALRELRTRPAFLVLLGTSALWNFSLNVAGPFFNVYMVQNLKADAAMIGITSIATTVASMLMQRKMGDLNDRWGARRLLMISGLLIPVLPFLWALVQAPWHIIPVNLLSGILWSGYNLAAFNYLLALIPTEQRARYSAIFQLSMMLSLAVGAAVGSLIVSHLGFIAVFVASGIGRFLAALLFARLSHEELPTPAPIPGPL